LGVDTQKVVMKQPTQVFELVPTIIKPTNKEKLSPFKKLLKSQNLTNAINNNETNEPISYEYLNFLFIGETNSGILL
jgi:hypothetical protein